MVAGGSRAETVECGNCPTMDLFTKVVTISSSAQIC